MSALKIELDNNEKNLVENGDHLVAIGALRRRTVTLPNKRGGMGLSLRDAKDAIDDYRYDAAARAEYRKSICMND